MWNAVQTDQKMQRALEEIKKGGELPPHLLSYVMQTLGEQTVRTASLAPLLFTLSHSNNPYSLRNHRPFEVLFSFVLPLLTVLKCCRQVGKSENTGAANNIRARVIPNFTSLIVTPLQSQAERLATDVLKKQIATSPFKSLYIDHTCKWNDSNQSFRNGSTRYMKYASTSADRIRGIPANDLWVDEMQDFSWEYVPIIQENLSGSPIYKNSAYSGTPKTFDNTANKLFETTTMSEWACPCPNCKYENIPSISHDLEKMIGARGPVCVKCGKELDPNEQGFWRHMIPERRATALGLHISQIIVPQHYRYERNWQILLHKVKTYEKHRLYNEVFGEACDSAERLISLSHLTAASNAEIPNTLEYIRANSHNYEHITVGIDWSGGGITTSHHSLCVTAYDRRTGTYPVLYIERQPASMDPDAITARAVYIFQHSRASVLAHDYTGGGSHYAVALAKTPVGARVVNMTYVFSEHRPIIQFNPAASGYRSSYSVDKSRSLRLLIHAVKKGIVRFPSYEACVERVLPHEQCPNMLHDFLNLTLEVSERKSMSDKVIVGKVGGTADDTCHAVNLAVFAIWYRQKRIPDIAVSAGINEKGTAEDA